MTTFTGAVGNSTALTSLTTDAGTAGSVAINGAKADAIDHQIAGEERLFGRFTILRRGKKNYGLVSWQ